MMTTHLFRPLVLAVLFLVPSSWGQDEGPTSVSNYTCDGGVGSEWSVATCWDNGVPRGIDFEAVLPDFVTDFITVDESPTLGGLTVGEGTTLSFEASRGLTLRGNSTNNGLLIFTGTNSFNRIVFDHLEDEAITLGGSGIVRLRGDSQNLSSPFNQVLINGPDHTIEGFTASSVGNNGLNIQNQGTISANVEGETLRLDPSTFFENDGVVEAVNGGVLTFLNSTYSGAGSYVVGDDSEFAVSAGLFENMAFTADEQDGDLSNNVVRNTGNMDLSGVTFEEGVTVTNNGQHTFDILSDVTNNGLWVFSGTNSFNRICFDHPEDEAITLGGSGIVRLRGDSQNLSSPFNQVLINGPDHTIEGFTASSVGNNGLNIQNQGTISANVEGESLRLDPFTFFENEGVVEAVNGGILTFLNSTYSGGGSYVVGDDSEFAVSAGLFENMAFTADEQDGDLSNNVVRNIGNMDLSGVTFEEGVTVTNNGQHTFDILSDVTNNGLWVFSGTNSFNRIFFDHPEDEAITLGGSGIVRLRGGSQNLGGPFNQVLINGIDHTIEGFNISRSVGDNGLNIQNQGKISANVVGETLRLDPFAFFENEGVVEAVNGGVLTFFSGTYSGAGSYLVGDDSEFAVSAGSFENMAFTADEQDGDLSNNVVRNTGNMDLSGVTFGEGVTVTNNGQQIFDILSDVTNNGLWVFSGTNSFNRMFFDHPEDEAITLGGSGIVRLRGGSQNLSGPFGQVLVNGPNHTIEGFNPGGRSVGDNGLIIRNEGVISANVTDEALVLDPLSDLINTGTLVAENGGVLLFREATYSGDGNFVVRDNSEFQVTAGIFENVVFSADNRDGDAGNNLIRNSGSMTLDGVTFEAGLKVINNFQQTLTVTDNLTNDGLIEVLGTNSFNRILFAHPDREAIRLGGTGVLRLTGGSQHLSGLFGPSLGQWT